MRFGSRSVCAFLLMPSLEHTNLCEVAFPSNLHLFLTIFYPKHPSLIRIYEPHTNLRCHLANFCHCTTLSKMHNTRILPKFKTTCIISGGPICLLNNARGQTRIQKRKHWNLCKLKCILPPVHIQDWVSCAQYSIN